MPSRAHHRRLSQPERVCAPVSRALLLILLGLVLPLPRLHAQQTLLTRARTLLSVAQATPAGDLPGSTPLTLTLRLQPSPAQQAALDALLAAQADSSSPVYHHWLTPAQFADQFSPSAAAVDRLSLWLTAQGLSVTAVSPTRSSLTVSGTADRVEAALGVHLSRVAADATELFANTDDPALPADLAALVLSVEGLDNLPSATSRIQLAGAQLTGASPAVHVPAAGAASSAAPLASEQTLDQLAAAADANQNAVLLLSSSACTREIAPAQLAGYRAVLRQAEVQGITVLATSGCAAAETDAATTAFPASLAEATSLTLAPAPRPAALAGPDIRPSWQSAPGLPADSLRHEPDFAVSSAAALAQTVQTLVRETGNRVGNLSPTLYTLAKTPGLFSESTLAPAENTAPKPHAEAISAAADTSSAATASTSNAATATTSSTAISTSNAATSTSNVATSTGSAATATEGAWTPSAGLGTLNLQKLLEVYPRGLNTVQVSLVSSSYALSYGDTFTLTSKVLPYAYASQNPTGTVTFTASGQGTIGSVTLDSSGTATLTPDILPVGTYSVTATYSGDANYAGGSSTSRVTITISIVNARLTASIAPQTNVPYGSTGTVTATVALPGAGAAPSGPVTAQIEGVTGAVFTATLSPNPGGNTATANVVVSMPSPGSYTVQVSCLGSTNYQCQTPVNLPISSVKGYTNTVVSVTPAAPQAGQPISLTATVTNAGNGTGTYTYNGSVTFYDSGKLLAVAPLATNQATTTLALSGNRTHNITATYTGDSNWNGSTSGAVAVSPTILPDNLSISSNVSGSSSLAGVNIVLTATSSTSITYGTGPTGTVSFFDTFNNAVVQIGNAATLVSNGPLASIGIVSTTGLLPGTHRIYAVYSGDDNYAPSTTPVLQLTMADFSVSMTPSALTIAQGKSQQVTVLVGASGGFAGAVSLGCVPPSSSQAACTFAPSSVTGGGLTTLTITTTAAQSSLRRPALAAPGSPGKPSTPGLWTAASGASLAGLLALLLPAGRRRSLPRLLLVIFAVTLSANLGCGLGVTDASGSGGSGSGSGASGSAGTTPVTGSPLGSQTFTITAAGSDGVNTVRHTYQYQVTIQ